MLMYKVAKKYMKGHEQMVAKFDNVDDAKKYIFEHLKQDAMYSVNAIYLLYDMGELMETFDQNSVSSDAGGSSGSASGGQQQSSAQNFRPSPLQTNLRPTGMPPSSYKDEDGGDKKK